MTAKIMRRAAAAAAFAAMLFAGAEGAWAQEGRLTTAQIKQNCKKSVEKLANGDVVVRFGKIDKALRQKAKDVSLPLFELMAYLDPNLDYEKFNKSMVREAGEAGNSRSMAEMIEGASDFLASSGIKLRKIKFSALALKSGINDGIPFLATMRSSPSLDDIAARSKRRAGESDMKAWKKHLRDNDIEKPAPGRGSFFAQIRGYNPTSGEFLIVTRSSALWMTQDEAEACLTRILEVRL